jgi:hypothetical protein
LAGTRAADVSEVKLPEVIAVDEIDRLAVTVPEIAGSDAMVTLFPTVTDEIEIGTVPEMDAVTEPIWAVPATRAGSVVSDTGCVA